MPSRDIFGRNNDVDSGSVPETIWPVGGLYSFPSAAAETTIVSTDANDAAGGTGARAVLVTGIVIEDGKYLEVDEEIALDGTTPVTLSTEFYRINNLSVCDVGSGGVNAGVIDVLHDPTILARILAGEGESIQAVWTAPNVGQNWRIKSWELTIARQAAGELEGVLRVRRPGMGWRVKRVIGVASRGNSTVQQRLSGQGRFVEPGSDIEVRVTFASANNNRAYAEVALESR